MSCATFGPLLLDDASAQAPEVQAHLATCRACQALLRAHHGAEALRSLPFDLPNRTREVPVRSLWRRRLLLRGTLAGLVAGVAAAAILALPTQEPAPRGPPPLAIRNAPHARAGEARDAVRSLILEVDSYTQQEAIAHDPALATFGALPTLLTPEAKH